MILFWKVPLTCNKIFGGIKLEKVNFALKLMNDIAMNPISKYPHCDNFIFLIFNPQKFTTKRQFLQIKILLLSTLKEKVSKNRFSYHHSHIKLIAIKMVWLAVNERLFSFKFLDLSFELRLFSHKTNQSNFHLWKIDINEISDKFNLYGNFYTCLSIIFVFIITEKTDE